MDVTGTVILNKKSNGFTEIGINSFSDGIYIINVSGDAYSYSQKVIIRR